MTKSIIVTKDGNKFKVLVCYVQRGITFSSSKYANNEAMRIGKAEHIENIMLINEQ